MIKESEIEQVILEVLRDGGVHKSAEFAEIIGLSAGRIDRSLLRMSNGRGDVVITSEGVKLKTADEIAGNAKVISDSFEMVEAKPDEKEVEAINSLGLTSVPRMRGYLNSDLESGQVVLIRGIVRNKDRTQTKGHINFLTSMLLDGVDYVTVMMGADGWAIRQLHGGKPAGGLKYKVNRRSFVSTLFCKRISDSIIERLDLSGDKIKIVFKSQPVEGAPNLIYMPFEGHEVIE